MEAKPGHPSAWTGFSFLKLVPDEHRKLGDVSFLAYLGLPA